MMRPIPAAMTGVRFRVGPIFSHCPFALRGMRRKLGGWKPGEPLWMSGNKAMILGFTNGFCTQRVTVLDVRTVL